MGSVLRLRPVTPGDDAFLFQVYASTRADELAALRWDSATRDAFLAQQFAAQHASWHTAFPRCDRAIVLIDAEPAGRLYVDRSASSWHIVDVALLPPFRGRGVGATLLARLLEAADRAGVGVSLHVEQASAARRLYERLGFVPVEQHGFRLAMQREAKVCS